MMLRCEACEGRVYHCGLPCEDCQGTGIDPEIPYHVAEGDVPEHVEEFLAAPIGEPVGPVRLIEGEP